MIFGDAPAVGSSGPGGLPIKFANQDAMRDFVTGLGGAGGCDGRGGEYVPMSPGDLTNAALKYATETGSSDPGQNQDAQAFIAKANAIAAQADMLQQWDTPVWGRICGRSDAREPQYHAVLEALKKHIKTYANAPMPQPSPDYAQGGSTPGYLPSGPASNSVNPSGDYSAYLKSRSASMLSGPMPLILIGVAVVAAVFLLRR